jgi:alkyldihydroxyacetonephosphate synthase
VLQSGGETGPAQAPPRRELRWWGWGSDAEAGAPDPGFASLARAALGISRPLPRVDRDQIELPPSRLSDRAARALAELLGAEHVLTLDQPRLAHTRGRSTADLLRIRAGDAASAPDAVLLPGEHAQVLGVLELCARQRIAVVAFGGGTSVVGGLEPDRSAHDAVVALDLRRLDRLLELDEVSRTATLEPGLQGPQAEALLGARGYTLGHHPQSFQYATLGGFAAARSSGQASSGYGRFDERVVGLRVASPRGTLAAGRAPRSAAGPDLRQLILGSEGALGVITALRLEVVPVPERRLYEGYLLPSFTEGVAAARRLAQDGPRPAVLRLCDEAETALGLARGDDLGGQATGGALAIVGFEGRARDVQERRERCAGVLAQHGARPDPGAGPAWERGRYRGPYLRDQLLDLGALVETLETACFWGELEGLHARVGAALRKALQDAGTPPLVLCHVSHTYASGASLYFTAAAAAAEDPIAQWAQAKRAAGEAIARAGATITHHHGVGREHRELYARELGEVGVEVLRGLKRTLDPDGILNPGVLIP